MITSTILMYHRYLIIRLHLYLIFSQNEGNHYFRLVGLANVEFLGLSMIYILIFYLDKGGISFQNVINYLKLFINLRVPPNEPFLAF